jgi:hypothetical protein
MFVKKDHYFPDFCAYSRYIVRIGGRIMSGRGIGSSSGATNND